jgi:DNA-binding transcriptional LysR family regulator
LHGNGHAVQKESIVYDVSIEYLYEAARLGTMRAAAQLLTVSPSSISRQITQLEAEIGVAVFEHGSRRICLTEVGQLLVDYYKAQLSQREIFEARLTDLKRLRRGRISLAVGEGFVGTALSAVLARFVSRHSGLQVDVRVLAASSDVARLVVEDEAHLGLVFDACSDPRTRVVGAVNLPLCAIMVPTHPLAHRSGVTLAELSQHALCLPEDSLRTRQLLKQMEIAQRITLQPSVTCNSIALLKSLLRTGELCTLLPPLGVADELARDELSIVPIEGVCLHETSAQVITRLGRQLLPAPLSLVPVLKSHLEDSARLLGSIAQQPRTCSPARLLA